MNITQERFAGAAPVIDGRIQKENYATLAQNCELTTGKLQPALGDKANADIPDTPSFMLFHGDWLSWATEVDAVPELLNDDQYGRVYWLTGSGRLKHQGYGREETTTDSKTFSVRDIYNPKPTAAPTIVNVPFFAMSTQYISGSTESVCSSSAIKYYPDHGPSAYKEEECSVCSAALVSGNEHEIVFQLPGRGYDPVAVGQSHGRLVEWAPKRGTIKLSNGQKCYFNFSDEGTQTQPNVIKLYLDNGEEYARLDVVSAEVYDIDTTYDGNPETGYAYCRIVFPCKMKLHIRENFSTYSAARCYLATYVDDLGQESPSSDVSGFIYVRVGDSVTVSAPKSAFVPGTAGTVRKVRFYRTGGSNANGSASFYFAKELSYSTFADIPATITFSDAVLDEELSEEHLNVVNPPEDMFGLVSINGCLAAAKGKDVYFSEPYLPFDWKAEYNYTMKSKIVGLAVSGQSLFVLTTAEPEVLSGSHPGQMSQSILPIKQPAVCKHAIVTSEGRVYYASPDGIVSMTDRGASSLATKNVFSRDQWQGLNPSTMRFAVHDGKIIVFTESHGAFVFYPDGEFLTTENRAAVTGLYEDTATDTLYIRGTGEWRNDTDNLKTLLYRSRVFSFVRPVAFSAARVIQYPASGGTFRLYSVPNGSAITGGTVPRFDPTARPPNSTLIATVSLTGEKAFRLPFMRREMAWFWEVETTGTVSSVDLANSIGEIHATGRADE